MFFSERSKLKVRKEKLANDKKKYYFNAHNRESQMKFPKPAAAETCKCNHILVKRDNQEIPPLGMNKEIKTGSSQISNDFIEELRSILKNLRAWI